MIAPVRLRATRSAPENRATRQSYVVNRTAAPMRQKPKNPVISLQPEDARS